MKAFHVQALFSGSLFRALVSSAAVATTIFFIHMLHLNLFVSAALVAVSMLAYAWSFWKFSVDDDERLALNGISRQVSSQFWRKNTAAIAVSGGQ
jgi:hypothetical protein